MHEGTDRNVKHANTIKFACIPLWFRSSFTRVLMLSSVRDANKSCSCLICLDIPGKRYTFGAMFN